MIEPAYVKREPHVFDPIILYGERMTIVSVKDRIVGTHDDAGMWIERWADRLWWDGSVWRDRSVAVIDDEYVVDVFEPGEVTDAAR